MSVQVRCVTDAAELEGALALRRRVFCEEQGVSEREEFSDQDSDALHIVAVAEESVLGTCRLLFVGDIARLGRLAVDRAVRRQGIASALLDEAERQALRAGAHRIRLNAQTQALALYTAAGYSERGQRFLEVGIEHIRMEKTLA
ncbi:MAG: GNAT family N-acetyltransferase [Solirubrobacteraceae bacterium]